MSVIEVVGALLLTVASSLILKMLWMADEPPPARPMAFPRQPAAPDAEDGSAWRRAA